MSCAYAISEAATRAGVTVNQVRIYVTAGLVRPCAATPGGHFLFSDACVERLHLIASATRAGLRIAEIGALIKALEGSDRRALRTARRSVAAAIRSRQSAIRQLDELVSRACGESVPQESQ